MRALFTQFSLLIGVIAFLEFQTRLPSDLVAISLGVATSCTVYIVLLLGDYTIHKYLDEKASEPASIRLVDSSISTITSESEAFSDSPSFDETAIKAA